MKCFVVQNEILVVPDNNGVFDFASKLCSQGQSDLKRIASELALKNNFYWMQKRENHSFSQIAGSIRFSSGWKVALDFVSLTSSFHAVVNIALRVTV